MISDGSELLLLVPSWAGLIGSCVLPFLGSVPDAAIVVFSGMGDAKHVKEEIAVGVGALAGSTILLVTIPWAVSIFAGRVSITKTSSNYTRPPGVKAEEFQKLKPEDKKSLTKSGVEVGGVVKKNVLFVIFSAIPYLVVQIPVLLTGGSKGHDSKPFRVAAYIGLGIAIVVMIAYFVTQYIYSKENIVTQDLLEREIEKSIKMGLTNISSVLISEIEEISHKHPDSFIQMDVLSRVKVIAHSFFIRYDNDRDKTIDVTELKSLLTDLGEPMSTNEVRRVIQQYDTNKDGRLSFDEFCDFIVRLVNKKQHPTEPLLSVVPDKEQQTPSVAAETPQSLSRGSSLSTSPKIVYDSPMVEEGAQPKEQEGPTDEKIMEFEEEEVEMPRNLEHLTPKQQQTRIKLRAFLMMLVGTIVVIVFSDPMVEVMSVIGKRAKVKPFYVSFILAPLISNASELIASFAFAKKKTMKSITVSVSALQGSCVMNNTVCLGVFLLLIALRELSWEFTAETFSILFVEAVIVLVSFVKRQSLVVAIILLLLYPVSLLIVGALESAGFN